jgi:hypothetical protein
VFNCGRGRAGTEHLFPDGLGASVGESPPPQAIRGSTVLARGMPYRRAKGCLIEGGVEVISLYWDSKLIRALELAIAFLAIIIALVTPA